MNEVRPLRAYAEVSLGRQRSPANDTGPNMVPYLRAANVQDGVLDLTDVKEMNFSPDEQVIFSLRPGDVLVTEGSGSIATVGASAVWSGERSGTVCFQNTLLRLRPRERTDSRFLAWWCRHAFGDGVFASIASGANIFHISAERVRALPVRYVSLRRQCAIADYLDAETTRIDALIAKKQRLIALLEEHVDSRIRQFIGGSVLAGGVRPAVPVKRLLSKIVRQVAPHAGAITAYRDGQVTLRSNRRAEGYTESWTENATRQGVAKNDVIIHGLDGFAGAIGTSEANGACSPVYHVCEPRVDQDPVYLGRMLRILAVSGYLGLFASSTRERAVDFRNWALFGSIPVPGISRAQQREIGDSIRSIKPLKSAVEGSAALARERRQALITAAVTGELEVPGAAA